MAIAITGALVVSVIGFILGAIKVKKIGVVEGIAALLGITLMTVGSGAVADIAAIPLVGMLVTGTIQLVTLAAIGGFVRVGVVNLLAKVGVKL